MAAYLTPALALLLACLPAATLAQALADPTRPPRAGELSPQAAGHGVLQSVLIAGSLREAIISGRVVHVGERYGEAEVVKIDEGEVVLRGAQGLQTLKLYPGIETRHMAGKLPAAPVTSKSIQSK